jgi:hypothetical protein
METPFASSYLNCQIRAYRDLVQRYERKEGNS